MAKTLSIIIPVYNEANTIHLILDKVKDVTLMNGIQKQLIMVDDCSKDDSIGAIEKYKAMNEVQIEYIKMHLAI